MNEQQRQQLDEQGYLIFKNVLSPSDIETLLSRLEELWSLEGNQAGEENYIEVGRAPPGKPCQQRRDLPRSVCSSAGAGGGRNTDGAGDACGDGQCPGCAAVYGRTHALPHGFRQRTGP